LSLFEHKNSKNPLKHPCTGWFKTAEAALNKT